MKISNIYCGGCGHDVEAWGCNHPEFGSSIDFSEILCHTAESFQYCENCRALFADKYIENCVYCGKGLLEKSLTKQEIEKEN